MPVAGGATVDAHVLPYTRVSASVRVPRPTDARNLPRLAAAMQSTGSIPARPPTPAPLQIIPA
eukprot:5807737-Heterocapsa_arctica.AAC.1